MSKMKEQKELKKLIEKLQYAFSEDLKKIKTVEDIGDLHTKYLGRKSGKLNKILRLIKTVPPEEKKVVGSLANSARKEIEAKLEQANHATANNASLASDDLTLPGIHQQQGHLHPMTQIHDELRKIFRSMGFMVFEGPELDNDFYNFEALNFPLSHPARDIQDTFFVKSKITRKEKRKFKHDEWVMRTHTSNMQVRTMEQYTPPLRAIIIGRCYRNEATDATHEHTFPQMEGFVVDENVTVGQLVWTLREIFRQIFKADVKVRLRPGFFPFTEPSYEPEMSCVFCIDGDQQQCKVCKGTGWVEMAGSGMIHPNVFHAAGYPEGKYTGFAFGMGTMRLAMLRYGIPDIRMFQQNDIRFLQQF